MAGIRGNGAMDGFHSFGGTFDSDSVVEVSSPLLSRDERRLHVRARDYWSSLLKGRACPSIEDLDPASLSDFGPNSVLLDFSRSAENPTVTFLGRALRDECGMLYGIRTVADVPERSLLSRLTAQFPDILATRRPVGFEAEFLNHQGLPTLYRGILLPFSRGGEEIDFVYGVISWKHDARVEAEPEIEAAVQLSGKLEAARATADLARLSEKTAHTALYAAIGRAYDFFLASEAAPGDYAELLAREGLTVQDRAPMTPIVKLVFGLDYDKKRLTEYAASLTHAARIGLEQGGLAAYLESYEGGLKALVAAERAQRTKIPRPDPLDRARERLRSAEPQGMIEIETGDAEFVLLIARRAGPGQVAVLKPLADPGLVERALRNSLKR
jgi:hypothetical protein